MSVVKERTTHIRKMPDSWFRRIQSRAWFSDASSMMLTGSSRISGASILDARRSTRRSEDAGDAPGVWKDETKEATLSRTTEESSPRSRALLVVR